MCKIFFSFFLEGGGGGGGKQGVLWEMWKWRMTKVLQDHPSRPFPKLAGKKKILWTKLKSSSKRERLENNATKKCEGCVSGKKVAIQWEARQGEEDITLQ